MAKQTAREVLQRVGSMFESQKAMLPHYQTIADNFYPERADFYNLTKFSVEMADTLVDSYPVLVRRTLGNAIHSMLRDGRWFDMETKYGQPGHNGRLYLDWATDRMYEFMGDRASGFVRAVKEGDMDYTTFGQTAISIEPNRNRDGIVYRCWHLRDLAWFDDEAGNVCGVARKWRPKRMDLVKYFGKENLPDRVQRGYEKDPFAEEEYFHVQFPADMYDTEMQQPYISLFVDKANEAVIEEMPLWLPMYAIPRFQTISGSPYAYSPATLVALPDARTVQAMTHTLLEAGERYARPPLIGQAKVVQGTVNLGPDQITWVDNEYDERQGHAIRPLGQDKGGYPIGTNERMRVYDILDQAFFLSSINLPLPDKEMTAYEFQERMKQFRRENLPLFAPIETEYNGQICEMTFNLMMQMGLLGSPGDIPEELQGADIKFKYQSPLTQTEDEQRSANFRELSMQLAETAQIDPGLQDHVALDTAFREVMQRHPASWMNDTKTVQEIRQQKAAQQAAMAAAGVESGAQQ